MNKPLEGILADTITGWGEPVENPDLQTEVSDPQTEVSGNQASALSYKSLSLSFSVLSQLYEYDNVPYRLLARIYPTSTSFGPYSNHLPILRWSERIGDPTATTLLILLWGEALVRNQAGVVSLTPRAVLVRHGITKNTLGGALKRLEQCGLIECRRNHRGTTVRLLTPELLPEDQGE